MLGCREWLSSFERKFACGVRPVALPQTASRGSMGRVLDLTASMARVVACDVRTFSRPAKFCQLSPPRLGLRLRQLRVFPR